MTSFTMTPPLRTAEQAARDFIARADEIDGRIAQLESMGSMFLNARMVREWRALKDERGRLLDHACTAVNAPIERLRTVLFDDGPDEGRAA